MLISIRINADTKDGAQALLSELQEAIQSGKTNHLIVRSGDLKAILRVSEDSEVFSAEQQAPTSFLEDHEQYPDMIDYLQEIANYTKEQLVAISYDESGEGERKTDLRAKSRGELIALALDAHFGATCQ